MLYTNKEIAKRRKVEIKMKKLIQILMYCILIPIIIYNISLIAQSIINPNETPSFLGIKSYVIISGSMEPNINIGDIVITKNIENEGENVKIGDVISYRKGQAVITHRVVQIDYNEDGEIMFKTKGDSNNAEDSEEVKYSNIEGKVERVIPKIGRVSLLLQNKLIIILILMIFYIYLSRNYKKNKKRNERKLKRLEHESKKINSL
ncbi:MAG: signal peptidase I [Clostridia bacterium]|nr:signal peptidase I [Clostridia bacterium]